MIGFENAYDGRPLRGNLCELRVRLTPQELYFDVLCFILKGDKACAICVFPRGT